MPSVNAYFAEFLGKGLRGAYLVLLEASWAIGSILIGLVAVLTVQNNWRITYWVFAMGLLLLPVCSNCRNLQNLRLKNMESWFRKGIKNRAKRRD